MINGCQGDFRGPVHRWCALKLISSKARNKKVSVVSGQRSLSASTSSSLQAQRTQLADRPTQGPRQVCRWPAGTPLLSLKVFPLSPSCFFIVRPTVPPLDDAARPPTPPSAKQAAAAAPAPSTRGTQKARGGPAARGGRYYPRGGKPGAPRENQNGDVATEDAAGEAPRKRCTSFCSPICRRFH